MHAEFQGAQGVVLNPNDLIRQLKDKIDIPVTITIVSEKDDINGLLQE